MTSENARLASNSDSNVDLCFIFINVPLVVPEATKTFIVFNKKSLLMQKDRSML